MELTDYRSKTSLPLSLPTRSMNFARLIRMSRVKFYELWKQGKGPKFYWNGKCRRITHRANNPTHSILAAAMNLDAKSKLPCQAKSPTFVFCEAIGPPAMLCSSSTLPPIQCAYSCYGNRLNGSQRRHARQSSSSRVSIVHDALDLLVRGHEGLAEGELRLDPKPRLP